MNNLARTLAEAALANGLRNTVTHPMCLHRFADHAGASSLFDTSAVRIGHEETRGLLLRDNHPTRPALEMTFEEVRTLDPDGERIELAWRFSDYSTDTIYISSAGPRRTDADRHGRAGTNSQLIVNLILELTSIVGEQPTVAEVPPRERTKLLSACVSAVHCGIRSTREPLAQ